MIRDLRTRINELSKGKLQSYIGKAVQSYGDTKANARTALTKDPSFDKGGPDYDEASKHQKKSMRRFVGINQAVRKIAKGTRVPASEEVINEAPSHLLVANEKAATQDYHANRATKTWGHAITALPDGNTLHTVIQPRAANSRGYKRGSGLRASHHIRNINDKVIVRGLKAVGEHLGSLRTEETHDETWYGNALNRQGKSIGRSGPHSSRDEAKKYTHERFPKAHSISTGYGYNGNFDIRNHSKNYDGSLREATEPTLNQLMLARAKRQGLSGQIAYYENAINETPMPSSVIKAKQRINQMTDDEKRKYFAGKSKEQLQSMAWRHGHGKGSNEYARFHDGISEGYRGNSGIRSPWRKSLGTSSGVKAQGVKSYVAPDEDAPKPIEWDMEKAIEAAKARLKTRKFKR